MRTVYKYMFGSAYNGGPVTFGMPEGSRVLRAGLQGNQICIWAEVHVERLMKGRTFQIVGTGYPVPDGAEYIGTVDDGTFVWHVYETKSRS